MTASLSLKLTALWIASCVFGIYLSPWSAASAESTNDAYCFKYTWLGPTFDNTSKVNGTCEDFSDEPPICINPLVYTADGSPPNTTAMWMDDEIRDRKKYSFESTLENSTHLCTKITVDGRTPMRSGCETQFKDGYTIEVCACISSKGPKALVVPCNQATGLQVTSVVLISLLLFLLWT
ncbi:hypothetical protein B566_EDAN003083 [Ephemera danica]|nr:hypothetical protein B566_EDAN003083 [Ephemera danica]